MVIGITGGIGSGKSTVIAYIKEKIDVHTLLTDDIAKALMKKGEKSYIEIVDYFGNEILSEDESIDSSKLGKIVFNDKEKLEKLNSITHPNVINYVKNYIKDHKDSFILLESALLLDTTLKNMCDEIWFIDADKEIRLERLMEGRNYTKEKALDVMKNQKDKEFYLKQCQITINNSTLQTMKESIDFNLKRLNL